MYRILVAGGDKRNVYLAKSFAADGLNVWLCGFDDESENCSGIKKLCASDIGLIKFDLIALPLPVSPDNINLNTPFCQECICLEDILDTANDGAVICGGRINKETAAKVNIIDYSIRDDFAYLNAVPTAEGAIENAMKKSGTVMAYSKCMVTGFGKCGEILAHRLKSLMCDVTVFARSAKDLSHARALGFNTYHLDALKSKVHLYDMIFNTIPFGIFDNECIKKMKKECIFTDIASAPGGMCHNADTQMINYSILPGLPGKYSPITSAQIIKEVILTIIHENRKDAYECLLKNQE